MIGHYLAPTLLMSMGTCDITHYVAVLQQVGCYIGMLHTTDMAPSNSITLTPPTKLSLRGDGGFLSVSKTDKQLRVLKQGTPIIESFCFVLLFFIYS